MSEQHRALPRREAPAVLVEITDWARAEAQVMPVRIAVFVDQLEQLDDAARCDLHTFKFVEPDALAGVAQVENDFAMMQPLEAVLAHGLLAGRAGCRFHGG